MKSVMDIEHAEKPSAKQTKRRKEHLDAVRARVQQKLDKPPAWAPQAANFRHPRYDDTYEQGVMWLDSLAGNPSTLGQLDACDEENPRTNEQS